MNKIINFPLLEESETSMMYIHGKTMTFHDLKWNVLDVIQQIKCTFKSRNAICLICVDDYYMLVVAILAASKLQYTIMPYLSEEIPEINIKTFPSDIVVICDSQNYNKFELLPCEKLLLDPLNSTNNLASYIQDDLFNDAVQYVCGTIDKKGNLYIEPTEFIDDVKEFTDLFHMTSQTRICLNGCKNNKIFLLLLFSAIYCKSTIYCYCKSIEYNPIAFSRLLNLHKINILTMSSFTIEYLYKLSHYITDQEIVLKYVQQFIVSQNTYTNKKIDGFIKNNQNKLMVFPFQEDSIIRTDIYTLKTDAENYLLCLIISKLKTLVIFSFDNLTLNDSIASWGMNSLNFVQIMVYLEDVLKMEFQDEMLAYSSYNNFGDLIQRITQSWVKKMDENKHKGIYNELSC